MFSLIVCALFLYFLYYELYAKRKDYPPGPTPWPVVGNIFQIDQKNVPKTVRKWSQEYGPVFTIWAPQPTVLITDYDVMKNSIVKEGDTYSGRPRTFIVDAFCSGSPYVGIVFAHGAYWKEQRRFALHVLRDFGFGKQLMEQKVIAEAERLVEHTESLLDSSGKAIINPIETLSVCVGSIISCLTFGHPYDYGDPDFLRIKQLVNDNVQIFTDWRLLMLDQLPWLRHLPILGHFAHDDLKDQVQRFRTFFFEEIDAHKAVFEPDGEATDYIDAFLKERYRREQAGEEIESFNDEQLFFAAVDIWAAGMETTVTTLSWMFLQLLYHPEIQAKVHAELDNVLDSDAQVTLADRARLPYVCAAVNEIQRYANILPFNLPHTNIKEVVLEGHKIPANTTIIPQISAVLSDPKIFPDPDKFDPGRFLDSEGNLKKVEQLVPFSLGKRICLGESLARMELFLIFANFMHRFRVENVEGMLPSLEPVMGLTKGPQMYEIRVVKR